VPQLGSYLIDADVTLDGTPETELSRLPDLAILVPNIFFLGINQADLPNLKFSGFLDCRGPQCVGGSGGSVTILSDTLVATPLPTALRLFGTALAGLCGVGWIKRRGKVS
jgi:hypothetical protein